MLQVGTPKGIKFDVSEDVADEFRQALSRKKIGYSEGAASLMEWFVRQDGMLQSLILGQVDEEYRGQVARLVLERMIAQHPLPPVNFDAEAAAFRTQPPPPQPRRRGGGGSGKRE